MDNVGLKRGSLELLDYNDKYATIFLEEKKELEKLLKGHYTSIEHVGSTAIKNIKSKPIIDILVTTSDLAKLIEYVKNTLDSSVFSFKEENKAGDFLIRKEEDGKVKAFIHVFPDGHKGAKECIIFRDYMNKYPKEARRYETLKKELYFKYKDDRPSYTAGKKIFIEEVIKRAKNEIND